MDDKGTCLRSALRAATARSHERLDEAMRREGGWDTLEQYGRFLTLQHTARRPVEAWLDRHAKPADRPPQQSGLIERDLAELGFAPLAQGNDFAIPGDSAEDRDGHALGVAWVLAGSSLGNRSIVGELKRSGKGHWPSAFLSDPAMLAFWKELRTRLERTASEARTAPASEAAIAVFDHFLHCSRRSPALSPVRIAETQ